MILKIKDLSFTYSNHETQVLKNINISFESNKIYLLLGPSGCGKSSFANILSGNIPNNISGKIEGDVTINDQSILGKQSYEISKMIGQIMQDADTQLCTYRVEDELVFGLENFNYSREEMDKRVKYVLDVLDINDLRYRALNSLSGGQKQKVVIASILILDPPIMIFDEPTANLDPSTSKEVFEIIKVLQEDFHKMIIIIEHKLDYLIEYVDYVYIFNKNGYIEAQSSPKEVFKDIMNGKLTPSYHYPKIIDVWKSLDLPYEDIKFNIKEAGTYLSKRYDYIRNHTIEEKQFSSDEFLLASNINYSIGDKEIIKDLTFNIDKGDFLAIVGPNGAGKSTISAILLNLYKDYKGQVLIDNKSVKKYKGNELWEKAGLVFQNPEWQFVSYNVRQELEYSLKNLNLSKEKEKEKIDEFLRRFNLLEFKESNPYLLSQGQKRRLSVATMLITGQELLILDEPTYGQDFDNKLELLEYISELNSNGMTVIMVTHDMDAVIEYCNKVLLLKDGNSIYFGSNRKLFLDTSTFEKGNLLKPIYAELLDQIDPYNKNYPINIGEFIVNLKEKEWMIDDR